MKGKLGFSYIDVAEDLEYVWRTHVPTLSFKKYKIASIYNHTDSKNFSIVLEPLEDGKKVQRVICEWWKDGYATKNNIHFSEREAAKRLAKHIGGIVAGRPENSDIDIDVVNENMEFLKDYYPELVL